MSWIIFSSTTNTPLKQSVIFCTPCGPSDLHHSSRYQLQPCNSTSFRRIPLKCHRNHLCIVKAKADSEPAQVHPPWRLTAWCGSASCCGHAWCPHTHWGLSRPARNPSVAPTIGKTLSAQFSYWGSGCSFTKQRLVLTPSTAHCSDKWCDILFLPSLRKDTRAERLFLPALRKRAIVSHHSGSDTFSVVIKSDLPLFCRCWKWGTMEKESKRASCKFMLSGAYCLLYADKTCESCN